MFGTQYPDDLLQITRTGHAICVLEFLLDPKRAHKSGGLDFICWFHVREKRLLDMGLLFTRFGSEQRTGKDSHELNITGVLYPLVHRNHRRYFEFVFEHEFLGFAAPTGM
jgi:hypothetical protein